MRNRRGAIGWFRRNAALRTRGYGGLCLRAVRTAWGLPGMYADADTYWAAVPARHKHAWDNNPPKGAVVYWQIGKYGHVALSNGEGEIWGSDLPTQGLVGKTSIHTPRVKWGAKPVGWASWLNGRTLPL